MLTEEQIQEYESLVHQYSRYGNDGIANDLAHVLQSLRELQAENAGLREQLKGVNHGE